MKAAMQGQVAKSAADVYEEFFVPALFAEWAPRVADAAQLAPGRSVLDIACGTGVLTREAHRRVAPTGTATGLDCNPGMLAIARRIAPQVNWHDGEAEQLPFEDASFDAVISQFGLMFFEDRAAALRQAWRVLRPGGHLVVAVWDDLDNTPGYAAMTALIDDLFGSDTADALRAPYCLGDRATLAGLFDAAGIPDASIATVPGEARFPSIADWVHTDVKGWTLADLIDELQYQRLRRAAQEQLVRFEQPDGTVTFPHGAHIVTARKH